MKVLAILAITAATAAHACLWDSDTLSLEKSRFPGVAEIMSGKFPRHSPDYYEWRKKATEAQLAKEPKNPALYDDLAVAQHKLGDHKAAIATMQAKERAVPGIYETYSNLGTFYIYTGELDEALRWINKALAINPNAHFGREKYQKWLVEWVQAGKPQGPAEEALGEGDLCGYALFIAGKTGFKGRPEDWSAPRREALAGVTGMMRFADYDNPLLQEALGDVLIAGGIKDNASHLAAQAYLFASQGTRGTESARLLAKSTAAKAMQETKADSQKALKLALAGAQTYVEQVWKDEREWIRKGVNVAAEFEKKYLPRAGK